MVLLTNHSAQAPSILCPLVIHSQLSLLYVKNAKVRGKSLLPQNKLMT